MSDSPFSPELVQALVERTIADEDRRRYWTPPIEVEAPAQGAGELSPKMAMLLGGAADVASTLAFLKRGSGVEGNPMFGYFNQHPWTVLPTAALSGLAYDRAYEAVKSKSPKLADLLAGLLGGYHAALAANNLTDEPRASWDVAADQVRLPLRSR